jgi:hypothetical protein
MAENILLIAAIFSYITFAAIIALDKLLLRLFFSTLLIYRSKMLIFLTDRDNRTSGIRFKSNNLFC